MVAVAPGDHAEADGAPVSTTVDEALALCATIAQATEQVTVVAAMILWFLTVVSLGWRRSVLRRTATIAPCR